MKVIAVEVASQKRIGGDKILGVDKFSRGTGSQKWNDMGNSFSLHSISCGEDNKFKCPKSLINFT